jgi:hypothetical protein
MSEKFTACPVFHGVRFDEGGADSLLVISIFRGTNKVGYQALLYYAISLIRDNS